MTASNMTRGHSSKRARSSRSAKPARPPAAAPVETRKANPLVWEYAMKVTGMDHSRCEVLDDGAVIIHNHPVR